MKFDLDEYRIKAQLYPALLVIFPAVVALYMLVPEIRTVAGVLYGIAVGCGVLFLLSQLGRDRGKKKEDTFFARWGGAPTTAFLRHRDTHLDKVTKQRYHRVLEARISGLHMPTDHEETENPSRADEVYRSAVAWLREQTRPKERFKIVFAENLNYGFRRNMLGLKPYGIAMATATLLGGVYGVAVVENGIREVLFHETPLMALIGLGLVALLLWIVTVNESWMRRAGENYARALLQACDTV